MSPALRVDLVAFERDCFKVLGEHALTLRAWRRDPYAEVGAVLSGPVREDDA